MQPAQQQGLRFPSLISVYVLLILRLLVSICLAFSIQHIHSLRPRGVRFSHASRAALLELRAFRKSSGILCTTPLAISFLFILFYPSLKLLCKLFLFYFPYLPIFSLIIFICPSFNFPNISLDFE